MIWLTVYLPACQTGCQSVRIISFFICLLHKDHWCNIHLCIFDDPGQKKKKSTQVPWEYQQSCLNERGIYCLLLLLQADWYGKTVFAGVRLTCEKAILFWIILAEQPDLQETMTKMGPLISCHPLQYAFCGWIVRWSGVQRFTSENCSHIISVPALKKSPGELA